MAFGLQTNNNNAPQGETNTTTENGKTYCDWNKYQFGLIDAEETINAKGDRVKELSMNGVLNFMMTLGNIPQKDAEYATRVALPLEGEDNSEEELAHIAQHPDNYYAWVDEKGKRVRKQYRPVNPEPELVLAFDFQDVQVDYANHPLSTAESDVKPLRIDWNSWYRPMKSFNAPVRNVINFKTKTMSDKNPLYKIAKAAGILEQFIASGNVNDGHDYSLLAGVTVGLDVIVELREYNNKFYVDFKIKNPAAIVDIKVGGKVIASKESLLQSAQVSIPFVGIEFNSDNFEYNKEDLECICGDWKTVASRAKAYKPSPVKFPDFIKGVDWKDSTLYKALKGFGLYAPDDGVTEAQKPVTGAVQEPESVSEIKESEPVKQPVQETTDFDDD